MNKEDFTIQFYLQKKYVSLLDLFDIKDIKGQFWN
jgi:hypothetical protein